MPSRTMLILQAELADYRLPLFNRLSQTFDLTVAHAGLPKLSRSDHFAEKILPVRRLGRLRFVEGRRLRALIANADIVVAMFDLGWPQFVIPALAGSARHRWVLWGHRYGSSPVANQFRDIVMRRARALLMYGAEHNQRMVNASIDSRKIFVAPNTMHVGNARDTSRDVKRSYLFVGRIQPRKRLELAIRAFASIVDHIPESFTLDIVGSGPGERELRELADIVGVSDRVIFHSEIRDDADLEPLFARSIAYLCPGAVGLSVLHSFSYGVPVLTLSDAANYHGPEVHNLRNGENSIVVPDEAGLAGAMLFLAQNPEAAAAMGRAGFALYSQQRTIEHMVAGFVEAADYCRAKAPN